MPLSSSRGPEPLPFLEVKHRPGREQIVYFCRLLERRDDGVVLLYVLSSPGQVGSLRLERGTRTVGYFWPARPYNLYDWLTAEGHPLGWYFNAARDTVLHAHHVEWTDLGLDLLVLPAGQTLWIDEEEAARLGPGDRERAAAARGVLEATYPEVVAGVARETMAFRDVIGRA